MSEFSDLLSSYIDEKEIKVYSLLEYCNLDRSTMYKIINGKRNPTSMEVFQKIAEFLHLTPVEYRKFKEAYLISNPIHSPHTQKNITSTAPEISPENRFCFWTI